LGQEVLSSIQGERGLPRSTRKIFKRLMKSLQITSELLTKEKDLAEKMHKSHGNEENIGDGNLEVSC
jgi:hypothetical protein